MNEAEKRHALSIIKAYERGGISAQRAAMAEMGEWAFREGKDLDWMRDFAAHACKGYTNPSLVFRHIYAARDAHFGRTSLNSARPHIYTWLFRYRTGQMQWPDFRAKVFELQMSYEPSVSYEQWVSKHFTFDPLDPEKDYEPREER